MPIFEFRCTECEKTIEKIQRTPANEVTCPVCGKSAKRVVSIFSGSASGGSGGCAAPGGSGFS